MQSVISRAVLLFSLLLLPLAPVGADSAGSLADLAADVESIARDISVTTVLLLAYERLDEAEDADHARERIRELVRRERLALDELESRLDGEPPVPEPVPVPPPADPLLERIRSYGEAALPISNHDWLTKIVVSRRQELRYRAAAVAALRKRFDSSFPRRSLEDEKEKIGRALLQNLVDRDEQVRVLVAGLFRQFWPGMYQRSGYDPVTANFRERYKSYRMWREYLQK